MKKLKTLFVPLMACSFLVGCGCHNNQPVPPVPVVENGGIDLTYMRINVSRGAKIKFNYTSTDNDLKVYWGDGTVDNSNSHDYTNPGSFLIYITGNIDNIALTGEDGKLLAKSNDCVTNIIFSNHVTNIGVNAFKIGKYGSLQSAFIPRTVNSIGAEAFDDKDATIYCVEDKRDNGWDSNCFINDIKIIDGTNLYMQEDNILYATYSDNSENFASIYICCDLQLKNAVIADKITINNIDYPVTDIWESAFYEMPTLESVVIPPSVKEIGEYAFKNCTNLKSVTLNENLKKIGYDAFKNTGITSISIPTSVEEIGIRAFLDCSHLEKVEFKDNSQLKSLPSKIFENCQNIKELKLAEGLERLESSAIEDFAITEIVLPSSLSHALATSAVNIDIYAINHCNSLETIDASKFTSGNIPKADFRQFCFLFANPGNMVTIKIASGLSIENFTEEGWPEPCAAVEGRTGIQYVNV